MKATRRQFLNIAAGLSLSCAAAPLLAQSAASGKKLIVYFSWSGNTQYVANLIKEKPEPISSNSNSSSLIRVTTVSALMKPSAINGLMQDLNFALKLTTLPSMTPFLSATPIGGPRFRCRLPPFWNATISRAKPSRRFAATEEGAWGKVSRQSVNSLRLQPSPKASRYIIGADLRYRTISINGSQPINFYRN